MKGKPFLQIAGMILLTLQLYAQYPKIYARAGGTIFTSWLTHNDDKIIIVPAFSVSPGIRLMQNELAAVSVTFPISAGFSAKSNIYVGVDLPSMLELHIGSAAANNEHARLGVLLGGGLGYNYSGNYFGDSYSRIQSDFWGYRFESGISFASDMSGNTGMVLLTYARGMTDSRKNMIGIGVHLVIGYKN